MTIKKAIKDLELLIERRQKALVILKEQVSKMETDSGKEMGNTLIQVIENDIENFQIILSEILPKGIKPDSKRTKKSL